MVLTLKGVSSEMTDVGVCRAFQDARRRHECTRDGECAFDPRSESPPVEPDKENARAPGRAGDNGEGMPDRGTSVESEDFGGRRPAVRAVRSSKKKQKKGVKSCIATRRQ